LAAVSAYTRHFLGGVLNRMSLLFSFFLFLSLYKDFLRGPIALIEYAMFIGM